MARSGETIGKKEKEKKRKAKAREKTEKREERKLNTTKSTDQFAYLDENGNLSDTPPDPAKMREISIEEISHTGIGPVDDSPAADEFRTGTITYYNTEKAYGFIKDKKTGESIFVHASALSAPVRENDRVSFKTERTPKGMSAVQVTKEA